MLLDKAGSINRLGDGTPSQSDKTLYIGVVREPLFDEPIEVALASMTAPPFDEGSAGTTQKEGRGHGARVPLSFGFSSPRLRSRTGSRPRGASSETT
jgi:hypothetical protein